MGQWKELSKGVVSVGSKLQPEFLDSADSIGGMNYTMKLVPHWG